ncbi:hypothetical protein RJT34_07978 [Clitoria ternatea]|uniref:Uncharacterized protein n=1 Tax=Clitoria ternatea TaxID=43366 RepID=A0AAN9PVC2_CLITE
MSPKGVCGKDFCFKFMNTARVREKPLNLMSSHNKDENKTMLDGTTVLDNTNKGLTTFEPSQDVAKNSWDFVVSMRVYGDDLLKTTYETSTKVLGALSGIGIPNTLVSSR